MKLLTSLTFCGLSSFATAQEKTPFDAKAFFARNTVVDGEVNYFRLAGKEPDSLIGQPSFERDRLGRTVKEATGIDFGIAHMGSEASLEAQFRAFETGRYTGAGIVRESKDLDRLKSRGEYGVIFYAQDPFPLKGEPGRIKIWYDMGLRVLQLAYGLSEDKAEGERLAGGGGGGSSDLSGLTTLGKRVVLECVRLGIVIDVSHGNEKSTLELAAYCEQQGVPITANHASAHALRIDDRFTRGKTDAEMMAIAKTGGVVGIFCYGPWLSREKGAGATIDDFVAHLDHAVKLIGIDHVGVSTDGYLDGTWIRNESADGILDSPERFMVAAQRLHEIGYSEDDLAKVFGGNFIRVLRTVLDRNYSLSEGR